MVVYRCTVIHSNNPSLLPYRFFLKRDLSRIRIRDYCVGHIEQCQSCQRIQCLRVDEVQMTNPLFVASECYWNLNSSNIQKFLIGNVFSLGISECSPGLLSPVKWLCLGKGRRKLSLPGGVFSNRPRLSYGRLFPRSDWLNAFDESMAPNSN